MNKNVLMLASINYAFLRFNMVLYTRGSSLIFSTTLLLIGRIEITKKILTDCSNKRICVVH